MFSRSILRPAAQLRKNVRLYATEATSGGSKSPLIIGISTVAVAAGAYYIYSTGAASASTKAQNAIDKAKDATKMSPTKAFTGGDQGFVDLKLREVFPVNHNTKKFRFDLPGKEDVSGLQIASALLTKFKAPDAEKAVMRPYTPISDESQPGYLDLLVKIYPNGPMSEHIHSLKPGDDLAFKGPLPKYSWEANKHTHIGLVAGGTGITPMYQLIRQIFQNPADKTKVSLVFGNQTEEDILLRKEFDDLEKEFPERFRTFYTVDKAPEGWKHGKGVVTKELLETAIPGAKDENIKIFICGPAGFYKAISGAKVSPQDQGELDGILKELGYTKEQVYKF